MKKGIRLFVLAIAVSFPCLAYPQEVKKPKESIVTMDEIVVTGTRSEEKIERIPVNVTVIGEKEIANSNAKNVPDLLRSQEGIVVRDLLGNGKTTQVDLRGFGESAPSNTLVLVDGRRINEIDLSGVDWTQIPVEQIKRIEIVRGAGTVLYGDNAPGGVINIITKTPSEKWTASAGTSLGSYGYNNEVFSVSGGHGKVAASLFGNYQSTDGYRENNEFRAKNLGGKIVFDPADWLSFDLSGNYHSDKSGLPGALTVEQFNSNPRMTNFPFDEAKTSDGYLKLGSNLDFGTSGNLVADLAYRDRDANSKFVGQFGTFLSDSDIETWAFTPRYIWNGNLLDRKNTLIGGVDLYQAKQNTNSLFGNPPAPSGMAEVQKESVGFYVNDEIALLESLFLTLGARYESVHYDLSNTPLTGFPVPPPALSQTVSESEPAYVAGLSYVYSGQSSAFIRVNRSFRFPNTDELIEFDQFTGQPQVNSDLKPQTGVHVDLGVRHFFTPLIQANVTLFHAKIKNEIYFDPTPSPFIGTNTNYPETLHQGVELGCKADLLEKLTLFGNYTYEQAAFDGGIFDGKDIPAVPRNKFNLGFQIHDVVPGALFTAVYNYVGESFLISDLANQFQKLESYYTIDLRISYAWKWINCFFGVNNITNQKYSQYGLVGQYPFGTPQQPLLYPATDRNWLGGIELSF
jgi:iron complex outermembrane recepter protein